MNRPRKQKPSLRENEGQVQPETKQQYLPKPRKMTHQKKQGPSLSGKKEQVQPDLKKQYLLKPREQENIFRDPILK